VMTWGFLGRNKDARTTILSVHLKLRCRFLLGAWFLSETGSQREDR
jgi:hypothetical protein